MATSDGWEEANQRFLTEALRWLRLRLRHHATAEVGAPTGAELDPHGYAAVAEEDVEEAAGAMRATEELEHTPRLVALAEALGLTRFERDVLLLCAAAELDPNTAQLYAEAHGDERMTYPTFGLALHLFDDPVWDALSPEGGLRRWRLIDITQLSGQPLTASALRADERIVSCIKGLTYLDDRLEPLVVPVDAPSGDDQLPASQRVAVDEIEGCWSAAGPGAVPVVQLLGPDTPTKQMVAAQAAAILPRRVYSLSADLLPSNPGDLENVARLWSRESRLLSVALYLDAQDVEPLAPEGPGGQVGRFLARVDGVIFLGTREPWPASSWKSHAVDVDRPTQLEQRRAWTEALGPSVGEDIAHRLAGQFRLNMLAIQDIAGSLETGGDGKALGDRLWDACLARTRPRMDTLAQRLEAKATWDDIVLPPPELALLHQIADQVGQRSRVYETWGFGAKMNRGMGVTALFAGPSGTGKSMAAEVIANELRLTLYRIDLSAVVSKYIGVTEKNLCRLFQAAADGGALPFFDEADALFGKRSEVKDSHDRYANIEVNYLLQLMESYQGVAVLATNMKSALDPAFLRRLRFVVTFPYPGVTERRLMWEKVFPSATPVEGLDYDRLARLQAAGSTIKNIALNAAFVAAHSGSAVTMDVVLDAARTEFRKMELPVVESDFSYRQPEAVEA